MTTQQQPAGTIIKAPISPSAPTFVIVAPPEAYCLTVPAYNVLAFDFDYFEWLYLEREADRKEAIYLNSLYIEHLNRLQIALMFNIQSALYNRRMMFPKSGFLARAGRRKRN